MEDYVEAKDKSGEARVAEVLPALIWKRYGKVREFEARVKQPSIPTLHALRIEEKHLRYAIEFFVEAMGEPASMLLEPLVALQDHLGELHDADVASQLIAEFIASRARYARRHGTEAANFEGPAAYLSVLQARITELQSGFLERWQVIVRAPFRKALGEAVAAL
jgi:CHAD domain-containing protein